LGLHGAEVLRAAVITKDRVAGPQAAPEVAEPGGRQPGGRPPGDRRRRIGLAVLRAVRRVAPDLLVLAVFSGLAVAMYGNVWSDPRHLTPGGGSGDGSIFIWFLRWSAAAVQEGRDPFFSTYMNMPDGVSTLWNTSLVLPGIVLSPVTLAFGAVFTYNLVNTAALALSAFCGYLAIRRWVGSRVAAAAGGLVYGFSPAMYAQAHGHVHMTLMFLPPLMLLCLHSILTGRHRPLRLTCLGLLLGIMAAAQLLTGEEVLAFAAVACAAFTLVMIVLFPRQALRAAPRAAVGLLTALAGFMVLALWPLKAQLFGPGVIDGDIRPGSRFVSDLLGFVLPTHYQLLAPPSALDVSKNFTGNAAEWNAYLGIPLVLVLLFCIVRWWRVAAVRVAFASTVLIAVLSMGQRVHIGGRVTGVPLPWAVVGDLKLLESGLAARLMLFAWLPAGVLLAWFLWRLAAQGWTGRLVAGVVLVAVLVPLVPRSELNGGPVQVPAFFTGPAAERIPEGSTALLVPFPTPPKAIAMVWQAEAGMRFKIPGGYYIAADERGKPRFGPAPSMVNGLLVQARNAADIKRIGPPDRERMAAELQRWDVKTIVVGPVTGPPGAEERVLGFLTVLLGRAPDKVDGVNVWWDVIPASVAAIQDPPLPGTKAAKAAKEKAAEEKAKRAGR
jgi:hypothetical protein